MPRRPLLALALAAALAALPSPAAAHANYVSSNPAADARLQRAPQEIRVTFSEPVDPRGSAIDVFRPDGSRVSTSSAAPVDAASISVRLEEIGDGGYLVSWAALSSVDGHTTRGTFAFAVGNAPLPAIPDLGPSSPAPSPAELAGRALSYAGIALGLGVPLFLLLVRPGDVAAARERLLLSLAGALVLAGTGLIVLAQGGGLPDRFAAALALRAAAGAALLAAARAPVALRRELAAGAGLVAALSATLVSHAAASADAAQSALDLVHVVAVSAWLGGIVALAALVLPARAVRDALAAAALGAVVWRFSLLALVAVAAILATGVLRSLRVLLLPQDLVETPYGLALLAKIVLLATAVALGALNLAVLGRRLRLAVAPERAKRGLVRTTSAETALLALAIVATAPLTALAPPAEPSGAAYDSTQHVGGLRLRLLVASARPGRDRYVLRVQEGLRPVSEAQRVVFRFTMVEHDMGESEVVAEQRAPGEYVAQGSNTAMFGTWRVETIVRLPERDDVRTVFSVPVGSDGASAAARVLSLGERTAIAFTDPATPVAGAPFALNVVLVDAKGDPVRGATLTATAISASRTRELRVSDAGNGRYLADVDALEAGAWEIAVTLEGRRAAFPLTVSP
ncbi:MAG TPA: FixH family protein [Candidatus Limnocylindria bacterium]|nr:FixH family protein [Candidatus Limnocylindria bacterium]